MEDQKYRVLIVDDEKKICDILNEILEDEGFCIRVAYNGKDAMEVVSDEGVDLVLLDLKLPDTDGIALLKYFKQEIPDAAIVMISAFGTIEKAVEAIKLGADDFIEKPLETMRVVTTVKNAIEKWELKRETLRLRNEVMEQYRLIGKSKAMDYVFRMIRKAAPTNAIVLILGETGTGKELVARAIHRISDRTSQSFIKVNCAAIPGELIESELFGYEKGAFTGAYMRRIGQFELAQSGTLFLDEIGDLSLAAQAKLLRGIEEKEIRRIGGKKPIKVDARIIAATNKDLMKAVKEGAFRDDLYHRINVISINIPPLRERKDDIPLLANFFLRNSCIENNTQIKELTKGALLYLKNQKWSGNVRELKHLMEKLAILVERRYIRTIDIDERIGLVMSHNPKAGESLDEAKKRFERDYIVTILERTGWRIGEAAELMKIDRTSLFRKMKKLKIRKQR